MYCSDIIYMAKNPSSRKYCSSLWGYKRNLSSMRVLRETLRRTQWRNTWRSNWNWIAD